MMAASSLSSNNIHGMVTDEFSSKVLAWYNRNGRDLPWRRQRDPYSVWVSEIMLQQTRVETVIPYFKRWMERFPGVKELADASEQDALLVWEGLGYYSRARNLYKAARKIMGEYEGKIPREIKDLHKLPGIGRYTACAIASMAFGQDVATLDGNLRRVLARYFNVTEAADSSAGLHILWQLAESHLPKGHAGSYNQALMDLGAVICLPRHPDCLHCPLMKSCRAYQLDIQEQRPVLRPRHEIPHYIVTAAVIQRNDRILLAKRPSKGLLGGLWEFPGGKQEQGESLEYCLIREIGEELGVRIRVRKLLGIFRHAYTHFRITLHSFYCDLEMGEPQPLVADGLAWVFPAEMIDYPMSKVDRLIAERLNGR